MEELVREMCEEFIMSEACSEYYAKDGQETEAQSITIFLEYMEHAFKCKLAAQACREFLSSKNEDKLIKEFLELGLIEHVFTLMEYNK